MLITTYGKAGFFDKEPGLFNRYTWGFAVEQPDGNIYLHSLLKVQEQLPEGWRTVRYEEDGQMLFVVVETISGDRKRVLIRDENGYRH